jgi:hypothetical protein
MTEEPTDTRFLELIIQRTFEDIAFECRGTIDVLPVQHISVPKSTFSDEVLNAAKKAFDMGLMVLCVHADADSETDIVAFKNKIRPAFRAAQNNLKANCQLLVAIVPVQMTEAWLLADKDTMKQEIGTVKTDHELGLLRDPESIPDPKKVIENAILIANQYSKRRRRYQVSLSELYTPIGQKVSLEKLSLLGSFRKFKESVRTVYQQLAFLD